MAAIDRSVYLKATVAVIACAASSGVRSFLLPPAVLGVASLPEDKINNTSTSFLSVQILDLFLLSGCSTARPYYFYLV